MPDITMCRDNDCPMKDTCYRFQATPRPNGNQSYFYVGLRDGEKCQYYWEMKEHG